jgi:hypothetical protein
MLYPTTTYPLAGFPPMAAIDSSNLLVIPITIPALQGLMFGLAQLSPTQDYSLRAWISRTPGGDFVPTNASYWHLNRTPDQLILVYDMNGTPPPGNILAIPLFVGDYNLNILNLVNTENVFSFSANVVDCS